MADVMYMFSGARVRFEYTGTKIVSVSWFKTRTVIALVIMIARTLVVGGGCRTCIRCKTILTVMKLQQFDGDRALLAC